MLVNGGCKPTRKRRLTREVRGRADQIEKYTNIKKVVNKETIKKANGKDRSLFTDLFAQQSMTV